MRRAVREVPVNWVFQPKLEPPKMTRLKNGQQVRAGVAHQPWAETEGGKKIIRVYCYGCQQYFKSYHHYLWRHGLCKERPKGVN
jgi:hypothetical protein